MYFLAAAATVVAAAATAAGITAPAKAEDNDDEQNDPAAIAAPAVVVPTAHITSPHYLFGVGGASPVAAIHSILCPHPLGGSRKKIFSSHTQ